MKKLFTFAFLFAMCFSTNAQVQLSVENVTVSGTDLVFDIYLTNLGAGSFGLSGSDFVIDFDPAQFTSPTFTKNPNPTPIFGFIDNGFNTFISNDLTGPQGDPGLANNVQKPYYDNTSPTIIGSELIVNLNAINPTSLANYNQIIALIDGTASTHRLGQFTVSGYNGADDGTLAGMAWDEVNSLIFEVLPDEPTFTAQPVAVDPSSFIDVGPVVPIELARFDAKKASENDALIEWETQLEEDLDVFIIERSLDADNWTAIRSQTPNNTASTYSYLDENVYFQGMVNDLFYYRLKTVELDGSISYSDIKAVEFGNEGRLNEVSISPNPTFSEVNFVFDQAADLTDMSYDIFNAQGQLVKQGAIQQAVTAVDLNLASGVYFVQFRKDNNRFNKTERLVVINK